MKGFLMSAHEYMQRLDPTTLHKIRNVSEEVLNNRCERIDALSFTARDIMEQRQQHQQRRQQQQQQQQQQQIAHRGESAYCCEASCSSRLRSARSEAGHE